ncbi:hypothetical protein COOONC_27387 [Cooperia oncophora]
MEEFSTSSYCSVTQSCSPLSSSALSTESGSPQRKISASEASDTSNGFTFGGYGTGPTYGQQLFQAAESTESGYLTYRNVAREIYKAQGYGVVCKIAVDKWFERLNGSDYDIDLPKPKQSGQLSESKNCELLTTSHLESGRHPLTIR